MDNDKLDTEIRKALDARAHEVDVPVDLMTRTLETARAGTKRSLRDRLRARLDAWRTRAPVTGFPRWMYVGTAAAMAVALFGVGALVTRPPTPIKSAAGPQAKKSAAENVPSQTRASAGATKQSESGDLTSSNTSRDSDATTGDGGTRRAPAPPAAPSQPGKFPPKIVRTATIEVEVRSFDRAWGRANGLAAQYGGFVTNSSTEQVEHKLGRGTVTMRIPASKLDAALDDLRSLGTLSMMKTSGEDVAAQIVDLDARRRTLETEELQLLDLLRQARGVPEILEVRRHLDRTRQEIESLKAQKDYYADQVQYATVNATVFERGAEPDDEPGDGVLLDAWRTAFRVGLTILAGLLVVLGGLIPLAALGLAIWAAVRVARRRRTSA